MLEPLLSKLNELKIILASSSQQRASLLRSVNLKFQIVPSDFEENLDSTQLNCKDFVEQTALGKVKSVENILKKRNENFDIIIGSDTMVEHNGQLYGKPKDPTDAFKIIKTLTQSNIPNCVYSGVVIFYKGEIIKFTEVTTVYMMHLSDEEIKSYVESGEPMGKAGGYGIQGIAGTFVERINGDSNNVIGLPLCRLAKELKQLIYNN